MCDNTRTFNPSTFSCIQAHQGFTINIMETHVRTGRRQSQRGEWSTSGLPRVGELSRSILGVSDALILNDVIMFLSNLLKHSFSISHSRSNIHVPSKPKISNPFDFYTTLTATPVINYCCAVALNARREPVAIAASTQARRRPLLLSPTSSSSMEAIAPQWLLRLLVVRWQDLFSTSPPDSESERPRFSTSGRREAIPFSSFPRVVYRDLYYKFANFDVEENSVVNEAKDDDLFVGDATGKDNKIILLKEEVSDRFNINSQLEHLQAKYVGTGHSDVNRFYPSSRYPQTILSQRKVSLRGASARELTRDALLEKVAHKRELRRFSRRASAAALLIQLACLGESSNGMGDLLGSPRTAQLRSRQRYRAAAQAPQPLSLHMRVVAVDFIMKKLDVSGQNIAIIIENQKIQAKNSVTIHENDKILRSEQNTEIFTKMDVCTKMLDDHIDSSPLSVFCICSIFFPLFEFRRFYDGRNIPESKDALEIDPHLILLAKRIESNFLSMMFRHRRNIQCLPSSRKKMFSTIQKIISSHLSDSFSIPPFNSSLRHRTTTCDGSAPYAPSSIYRAPCAEGLNTVDPMWA
ncbi:hypothetical protein KSP40_PGU001391 [Platanthera guangdongensis]|uniref:Uncharacterized protein n=1 Tax=Platanthera guangdongensis TaxID=2320717 RepID=A0ABR2M907_9ASPA